MKTKPEWADWKKIINFEKKFFDGVAPGKSSTSTIPFFFLAEWILHTLFQAFTFRHVRKIVKLIKKQKWPTTKQNEFESKSSKRFSNFPTFQMCFLRCHRFTSKAEGIGWQSKWRVPVFFFCFFGNFIENGKSQIYPLLFSSLPRYN